MAPIVSPQIVDNHHPFPHLRNAVLHIGAWVKFKSREVFAVTPVPEVLPPVLFLPGGDLRYILLEELLAAFFDTLFPGYTIEEKVIFRVTRNADINPDDEAFDFDNDDFRKKMKKVLKQRMRLAPVRLELSQPISTAFRGYLKERLPVTDRQIFITSAPPDLGYAFSLADKLPEGKRRALLYPAFTPCLPGDFHPRESVIQQVQRRDRLLSYPFESMAPFLQLIQGGVGGPGGGLHQDHHIPPGPPGKAGGLSLRRGGARQGRDRAHRAAGPLRRTAQHRLVRAVGGRRLHHPLRL